MKKTKVSSIYIFPIKSLDGITIDSAQIIQSGMLENDRRFALFNKDEIFLRGKNSPKLMLLRTKYDLQTMQFTLTSTETGEIKFKFDQTSAIEKFFSDFLGEKVFFRENRNSGFPDDTKAHGPTIVSLESLHEVHRWFPQYSFEEIVRKFRANIIVESGEIFWEDKLYAEIDSQREFEIGDVKFFGSNACARCTVPTRDSFTSEQDKNFQLHFIKMRKENLPAWAIHERFDHFYRFAVNTSIPKTEVGKILAVEDEVSVQ